MNLFSSNNYRATYMFYKRIFYFTKLKCRLYFLKVLQMKIISLFFYTLIISLKFSVSAQTIVSYGSSSITKQAFLKAFLKNNNDVQPSAEAYREYLELYIRFKLKVRAAYDLRMDTLANQKAELADFRNQVAQGFLNDETSFRSLVNEAFERSMKDIHLAHIFIAFDSLAAVAARAETPDTMVAFKRAMTIYSELERGADFGQLATTSSADPAAASNNGDIGFITVMILPYAFENIVYTTPVGRFSRPCRSNAGYHIFKNLGERKSAGRMKAAQILLAFPPGASNTQQAMIKQRADSVYNLLLNGSPFSQVADRFSDDVNVPYNHGEIPEFAVGSFEPSFEAIVFAMEQDGLITKPIQTPVGYYIVKRLNQLPVNTDPKNDSAMTAFTQQVRNDPRMEISRKIQLQKIYHLTGFRSGIIAQPNILNYVEDVANKKNPTPAITEKTVLFTFSKQKVYVRDLIRYLQDGRETQQNISTKERLRLYEEASVRQYYFDHLEEYHGDFSAQVKEFKEGNLLFEIMQRNVWDKAAADSTGLKNCFDRNKNKYWWEASADAVIFSCSDAATAIEFRGRLEKDAKGWKKILPSYETSVQADSGRFELSQLSLQQQPLPAPGTLTEPLKIAGDSAVTFVQLIRLYPGRQPRGFEDAKGFVLNDYQNELEEKWIIALKKKYPVKINEAVFRTAIK